MQMGVDEKTTLGWYRCMLRSSTCGSWFLKVKGLDYFETLSPILRMASFRLLMSVATILDIGASLGCTKDIPTW